MNALTSVLPDYVQPTRNFSLAYVILDSLFIVAFVVLLFISKRKVTALWAIFGGLLYWAVDYGIFYLATGSREIYSYIYSSSETLTLLDSNLTGLVLFWMSMSYGIIDFAFIWMWINKDKKALEFTSLFVIWWICCPLIASFINNLNPNIICFMTTRGTNKYHGVMGIIMIVGYAYVIIKNIFTKDETKKIPIIRLFVIGFLAQFLWEFILLVFGIRSQNYQGDITRELMTLLQDSLMETNLGMPYIYFINLFVYQRFDEQGKKKTVISS